MKIDKGLIKEILIYGAGLLVMMFITLGNPFSDNSTKTYSNGDTRICSEGESEYGEREYYTEWEETYYDGKWIPTEEYDQIIEVEPDYGYEGEYNEDNYNTESNNNVETSQEELKNNEVLFIYKGYYYHSSVECEGLKDCYNIMKGDITQVKNELGLKACNWCVGE